MFYSDVTHKRWLVDLWQSAALSNCWEISSACENQKEQIIKRISELEAPASPTAPQMDVVESEALENPSPMVETVRCLFWPWECEFAGNEMPRNGRSR